VYCITGRQIGAGSVSKPALDNSDVGRKPKVVTIMSPANMPNMMHEHERYQKNRDTTAVVLTPNKLRDRRWNWL
jgi:hypothetical protein